MENRAVPDVIYNPEMGKVPFSVEVSPQFCGALLHELKMPSHAINQLQIEVSPKNPPEGTPPNRLVARYDKEHHLIEITPTPLWNGHQNLLRRRDLLWNGNATLRQVAEDEGNIVILDDELGKCQKDESLRSEIKAGGSKLMDATSITAFMIQLDARNTDATTMLSTESANRYLRGELMRQLAYAAMPEHVTQSAKWWQERFKLYFPYIAGIGAGVASRYIPGLEQVTVADLTVPPTAAIAGFVLSYNNNQRWEKVFDKEAGYANKIAAAYRDDKTWHSLVRLGQGWE